MLKLKHLFENFELAKEALKSWEHDELPESDLNELLSHFRISSNAVYPFMRGGKTCYLRLAPTDEKIESNIRGELEFLDYLIDNGYPALVPIPSRSGEKLLTLATKWGDYFACAFESVEGTPIEDTDYSPEIMYEYGKSLGRLHALSCEFTPTVKKWTHSDALTWVENVLNEYNAPSFAKKELAELRSELGKLPQDKCVYGLVHYDFEPDNVFYDERTKACSVIDFEDGMYNWYALDVAQAIDCFDDAPDSAAATAEFIRGYRELFDFTEEAEALLPLMGRFTNLFGYARLIRSTDEKLENEPDWLVWLRQKLGAAIEQKAKNMQG